MDNVIFNKCYGLFIKNNLTAVKNVNLSYTLTCEDLCKSNMCRKELKEKTVWNKRQIAEDDSHSRLCLSASLCVQRPPSDQSWRSTDLTRSSFNTLQPQIEIMSIQHIQNRSFTWQETLLHSWGDGGRPLHTGKKTKQKERLLQWCSEKKAL